MLKSYCFFIVGPIGESSSSSSSSSELGSIRRRKEGDEWICEDCNAVFTKYFDARNHARSPNHLSVMENRFPDLSTTYSSIAGTGSGGTGSCQQVHYCLICWFAFSQLEPLIRHYASNRHRRKLQQLGIIRLYRDERLVPQSQWPSAIREKKKDLLSNTSPPTSMDEEDSADRLIVLDEVKGSDDETEPLQDDFDKVKQPFLFVL